MEHAGASVVLMMMRAGAPLLLLGKASLQQ